MCWTVWVLIEATETYKVVVPEELDLFACLLHLDIFRRQRMDIEHLKVKFRSIIQIKAKDKRVRGRSYLAEKLHFFVRGRKHIEPPSAKFTRTLIRKTAMRTM